MRGFARLPFSVVAAIVAFSPPATAATWPERPIRFIVSQAAGGTPDLLCRLVTERVGKALGQQIFVENRTGGANVVGAEAAARATPDGYTFFWATAAALVTNPYTFKALPYDPIRDFVPVGKIADGPFLLLANAEVTAKTLPELIVQAKAAPGKFTFATDGARNFSGMIAAWINKLAGTKIDQVPYATMPQGIQDTIAGRVQLTVLAIPSAAPFIKNGALHPLAISTQQRAPGYEDVAPVADTFPGFDFDGWMAVVAPAATPPEIVARMNQELNKVLSEPDIVERLRQIGFYTTGAGTPAATGAFVQAQLDAWGKVVKEIGIEPQ